MKIFIGADHRGFQLKEHLLSWLHEQGHEITDCGDTIQDASDDYVDYTVRVCKSILVEPQSDTHGITICGSGIGVTMAANRFQGIRCALCISPDHAVHARRNDYANVLALASDLLSQEQAHDIIQAFLTTMPNDDPKYIRRCEKLDQLP